MDQKKICKINYSYDKNEKKNYGADNNPNLNKDYPACFVKN